MNRKTGEWDVRCTPALRRLRERLAYLPNGAPRPYYWKVDRKTARRVVALLARAYRINPKLITIDEVSPRGWNGLCYYLPGRRSRISVWPRAHLKSVFHEFYHALDHATGGRVYDSADERNRGWEFADRLWAKFTGKEA